MSWCLDHLEIYSILFYSKEKGEKNVASCTVVGTIVNIYLEM